MPDRPQPAFTGPAARGGSGSRRSSSAGRTGRRERLLRAIGECGRALLRADAEARLLEAVCDTLVRVGGYAAAWVAAPGGGGGDAVGIVASAGWSLAEALAVERTRSAESGVWRPGPTANRCRGRHSGIFRDRARTYV